MKIKRYNYPHQFGEGLETLVGEIGTMLARGEYVLGERVAGFERRFAAYCGVAHGVGVNSGTDALVLALTALGIGEGDEIITQANTFHATVAAICLVGATPVLVDAEPESFLIDATAAAERITPKTRAIMPVHLYGKPTPAAPIDALAARHALVIVEDAAQAHGARIGGRRVGGLGHAACFSFHPSKNLAAAGDGGMIVTDDGALRARLDQLRSLGQAGQNDHVVVGYNSKLDAIQAAILGHKLGDLDAWNAARRSVAARYRAALSGLPVSFQREDADEEHVYHLFQVRFEERDRLMTFLREREIDVTVRYPVPIHRQPAFADRFVGERFPVAEALADELMCLPIRPDMGDAEIDVVVRAIHAFFGGGGA